MSTSEMKNSYQKAAHRKGEQRVNRDEIDRLILLSKSSDPSERLHAANFLCPCHVRRNVKPVWDALFRMMEDSDVRVRRAAWHTLEDGGRPDDSRLDAIAARVLNNDSDRNVRHAAERIVSSVRKEERNKLKNPMRAASKLVADCDFCGKKDVEVIKDLETQIPDGGTTRPALVCQKCY